MSDRPPNFLFYYLSIFIERFAFYGVRGILVLYIFEVWPLEELSFHLYDEFIRFIFFGILISGFIGLLNSPKLISFIGMFLSGTCTLLLLIEPSVEFVKFILAGLALGTTLVKTNSTVVLAKLDRFSNQLYSKVYIEEMCILFGSFCGVISITYISEVYDFEWALAIAGGMFFLGAICIQLADQKRDKLTNDHHNREEYLDVLMDDSVSDRPLGKQQISMYDIRLVILLLAVVILFYFFSSWTREYVFYFSELFEIKTDTLFMTLVEASVPLILLIFGVAWVRGMRKKLPLPSLWLMGVVIILMFAMVPLMITSLINEYNENTIVFHLILMSVGTAVLQPLLRAMVVQKVKTRWAPLVLAGALSLIHIVSLHFFGLSDVFDVYEMAIICILIMSGIGYLVWLNKRTRTAFNQEKLSDEERQMDF